MKRLFILLFIFLILFSICKKEEKIKEEKGVFISYIDYSVLKGKSEKEMKAIIDDMIENISFFGLNSIILQVSSFNDAIYYSDVYLSSRIITGKEGDKLPFDILDYFISKSKSKNISVYAWINPYRIRNNNDLNSLNKNAYYYKWIGSDNIEIDSGIYLNPASDEVINYINKAVKELCSYDIKGILFDDYYYPSETIDLNNYEKTDKKISLSQYRINNINKLISSVSNTIKKTNSSIKFGLSPSGNIENNLNKEYLDIEYLLKENMIDFVIPQLYYGFENSFKPYDATLNKWNNINKDTNFYVALSLYKSGEIDKWAGKGSKEWIENSDIIKRQIILSRKLSNYKGFYLYRYEYLINKKNQNLIKELTNIKDLTVNS